MTDRLALAAMCPLRGHIVRLHALVSWYVSRVYFTSSISPGRQVLSNHASVGL